MMVAKYLLLVCAGGVAALVIVMAWVLYMDWRDDE
jgi:hypothetical protein